MRFRKSSPENELEQRRERERDNVREKQCQLEERLKDVEKELIKCSNEENDSFFQGAYFKSLLNLKISLRKLKDKLNYGA